MLTKRKILEIYLNEVEWGENIYGIEAASRFYFDKHADELSPEEAALLAGMLPNPRYYNPFKRPDKARDRQERVLFNMFQAKLISPEVYDEALKSSLSLRQQNGGRFDFSALNGEVERPCYQHVLEHILLGFVGDQVLYRGGRTITTTLDKKLQDALSRLDEAPAGTSGREANDQVIVVKEDDQIRAIVCAVDKESAVRDMVSPPESLVHLSTESAVSPDAITREQILLSAGGGKQ